MKKTLTLNLLVLLSLCFFVEFLSTFSEHFYGYGDPNKVFRLTRPEPYVNSIFFSKDFIEESFSFSKHRIDPVSGLLTPLDYNGKYFNVRNGRRLTIEPTASFRNTIYLFGGSSVFCAEVPDEYTIASRLQHEINHIGYPFRVLNYGVSGTTIEDSLLRLKHLTLKRGDVVVFIDGWNDLYKAIFKLSDIQNFHPSRDIREQFVRSVRRFKRFSALLQAIDGELLTTSIPPFDDDEIAILISKLNRIDREVEQLVTSAGAKYFHFLQPSLYAKVENSHYELQITENPRGRYPSGLEVPVRYAWPFLRGSGVYDKSVDLTAALESVRPSPFLDPVHINEVGNNIIAQEIFGEIIGEMVIETEGVH